MTLTTFLIRILVALVAGMAIGLERQYNQKNAGLRTHSLVALGAAIFVLTSQKLMEGQMADPTRVIGQVVTGIGFLGAGVILHQGANVVGLTTAASIWCSAALGCLAAAGYYVETGIATALILFINVVLRRIDVFINPAERNQSARKD